jgi:hypothetical protein
LSLDNLELTYRTSVFTVNESELFLSFVPMPKRRPESTLSSRSSFDRSTPTLLFSKLLVVSSYAEADPAAVPVSSAPSSPPRSYTMNGQFPCPTSTIPRQHELI